MEPLLCPECGAPMALGSYKSTGNPYYRCRHWPDCRGSHGAHADGSPLGIPANQATKTMRIAAHDVFDRLWKRGRMTRSHAYHWMAHHLRMTREEAHIGRFTTEQCSALIRAVWAWEGRRMGKSETPVEIDVQVLKMRDEAMLVTDGRNEVWIPFSLLDEDSEIGMDAEEGEQGQITIPEWKAFDTGLI